jgi:adenylate kinase
VVDLNLITLGPPGAGKGTQAARIARDRGIPKISTGDILREAVAANTDMGRRVKATMEQGQLVSDEMMIGIVRERLDRDDARRGFVLDGFPRTVAQAVALDEIVKGRAPLVIVELAVAEGDLVRRLANRFACESCGTNAVGIDATSAAAKACTNCGGRLVQRADDNEAVVRERLQVYHRQTKPLLDYYSPRPTFRKVDGGQTPERVAADLAAAVDAAAKAAVSQGAGR